MLLKVRLRRREGMAREEERVGLPLPQGAFLLQLKIPLVARITSCTFDLFAVGVKEAPAAVTGTRRTACTYTATADDNCVDVQKGRNSTILVETIFFSTVVG